MSNPSNCTSLYGEALLRIPDTAWLEEGDTPDPSNIEIHVQWCVHAKGGRKVGVDPTLAQCIPYWTIISRIN